MKRDTILFIILLCIFAGLLGYNYIFEPFLDHSYQQNADAGDLQQASESGMLAKVEGDLDSQLTQILNSLSVEQKVQQVLAVPVRLENTENESSSSAELFTESSKQLISQLPDGSKPGFVVVFGNTLPANGVKKQLAELVKNFSLPLNSVGSNGLTGIKSLQLSIAVDHEGGQVQRLSGNGFTKLPSFREWCGLDKTERDSLAAAAASELRSAGITIVFGPVIDVAASNSVLSTRTCDDQADLVALRARQLIEIYQKESLLPVLKHYPGIGTTTRDLHTSFEIIDVSAPELNLYVELLSTYPDLGVMISHAGIQPYENPIPCSVSEVCVTQLKEKFPKSLLFTDDLLMDSVEEGLIDDTNDIFSPDSVKEISQQLSEVAQSTQSGLKTEIQDSKFTLNDQTIIAIEALMAGNHVLVFGPGLSSTDYKQIEEVFSLIYQANSAFAQKMDAAVLRILEYKLTVSNATTNTN